MANLRRARARSGTGSVIYEEAKKLWKGRIRIDGKVVTYYGKTQAEAADKLDDAIKKAEDGRPIATARDRKRSVGEWLVEWLDGHRATAGKGGIELSTLSFYESYVHNHVQPALGDIKLMRLTPKDVRGMMTGILGKERSMERKRADGRVVRTGGRKGGTPYVANKSLIVLRAAIAQAVSDGDKGISRNVAKDVKPLKWEEPEVEPLTREEAIRFLEAVKGNRFEGLTVLVLATGLREQEALGLLVENIDLENRWLRVRTALSKHEGRYFLKGLKTMQSRRELRIPEFAVPALERWQAIQKADQEKHGDKWSNEFGLFFTNETGGPLNATHVGRSFQKVLAGAGLARKRFYDLRHGLASYMNAEGHQYRQIQAQLGWSNLSMLPRYTHLFPGDEDRVAVTLDKLFAPSKN